MITITGLTHKQKVFMDVMWSMEELKQVRSFISTLPTRDRQDCLSLLDIAVQDTQEHQQGLEDYEAIAISVIARASSR